MAKRFIILLILLIAICYATKVSSQGIRLNLDDIKDLLRRGVSSEMILELIKEQDVNFKATDRDLSALRRLGANDDVIKLITHGEPHGQLHIDANPDGAEVLIDGEYKGKTPLKIELFPGSKQLVVGGIEGYGKYEGEVTIEASKTTHRTIQLLRLFSITLTLTPPYSDVYLTYLSGNTYEKEYIKESRNYNPLVIKNLKEGKYRINIEKEDYKPIEEVIYLDSDKKLSRVIDIESVTIQNIKEKDVKSSGNQDKGHSEARVIFIEYGDYQCPFCGRFFKGTFPDIKREYIDTGKVEYIFKDFPLEFHKQATKAAEAANCAGDQGKYWEMHGMLFENQNNLSVDKLKSYAKDLGLSTSKFEECLDSGKFAEKVVKDIAEGKKEGVTGTPYFILGIKTGNRSDKKKTIVGARPFSAYKQEIDALLISVKNEEVNRGGGKSEVTGEDFINLEAQEKKSMVLIETSMGTIKLKLDAAKSPITVKNFLSYVDEKFYDGTIFHRIIINFMIQGGGFTQDMQQKKTKVPVKNEAKNGLKNKRGTIAMARTSIVDSATSQFFINVVDNDFLDHRDETPPGYGYAVFGSVIEGMDVVDKIKGIRTGSKMEFRDVPLEPVIIKSVKTESTLMK